MNKFLLTFCALASAVATNTYAADGEWAPAGDRIISTWGENLDPSNVLPEYPRPIMERESWMNLNGLWEYTVINKGDALPEGKADGRILVPFAIESSLSGVGQRLGETKELVYNNNGEPVYRLSSKNDKSKKVEITPDLNNKDTTDLQTVFAKLAKQYNELKFCDSRMEVFDGKRRFDVIFKDEGEDELTANEYSPFKGNAKKCSMYIDKLNSKDDDLMWELTSKHPVYFWIMEDKESKLPFIARVSVEDTPLGRLDVYTQNISIKD